MGNISEDPGLILGRWARFFVTLLNAKSDKLRLNKIKRLSQWPFTYALGVKPAQNELSKALRSMANAKAVGPDGLPVELLKLRLNNDLTLLWEFHGMINVV